MHDTIAFIETMGSDARLRHADASDLMDAVSACAIAPAAQSAICTGNGHALAAGLGVATIRSCLLFPVKEDDKDDDKEPDRDDEQEIILALSHSLIE